MKLFLLACLGGAIGSGARYGTDLAFRQWAPALAAAFPWATLVVNVVGCLAIGLGYGWLSREGAPAYADELRVFMLVGICGGLTTFSTFANQTWDLFRTSTGLGLANIAVSVVLSLGAAWLGLFLSGAR
ncbi:MAG: CrcB family protein [Planctomycetes bacterium]|nr:CrcB family protein [Planctomycetota bacterium]